VKIISEMDNVFTRNYVIRLLSCLKKWDKGDDMVGGKMFESMFLTTTPMPLIVVTATSTVTLGAYGWIL
jgi:hypothetical protein